MLEFIRLYKEKFEELEEEKPEGIENYYTFNSKDILETYVKYSNRPYLLDGEQCVIDYYMSSVSQGKISLKKILFIGLIALLI